MKHTWKLNEDGDIDIFAVDEGFHNGPECTVCGASFCHHCNRECYDDECPGE